MMEGITSFRGEYSWLSNFTVLETPLRFKGISYPTVEHFYVAMKSDDQEVRRLVAKHPSKGLKAYGKTLKVRDNWDNIKLDVMYFALRHKFSLDNPILQQKLIDTGDLEIKEGNDWGDYFWGVDSFTGYGENHLGELLMLVRTKLVNPVQGLVSEIKC